MIVERDIPPYYQRIKGYLSEAIKEITSDIKLNETGWALRIDKSSYPAVRFEIEVQSSEDKARVVNGTWVDGPTPRRMRRLPDKTYDLREGIQLICEDVLEQL